VLRKLTGDSHTGTVQHAAAERVDAGCDAICFAFLQATIRIFHGPLVICWRLFSEKLWRPAGVCNPHFNGEIGEAWTAGAPKDASLR